MQNDRADKPDEKTATKAFRFISDSLGIPAKLIAGNEEGE